MPKTTIYIDAANIIYSAKNLGTEIDILKLVNHLRDVYRHCHVTYFTGRFSNYQPLYADLHAAGVEIVFKEIYNEDSKLKANCDVEISHKITSDILLQKTEEIIVLSGDGDFVPLYDFAKSNNIRVRVLPYEPVSCSRMVKRRLFIRISYLIESRDKFEQKSETTNEKRPATT